jgi:hypothetical protein
MMAILAHLVNALEVAGGAMPFEQRRASHHTDAHAEAPDTLISWIQA